MLYTVKVTTKYNPLNIRSGPSTGYDVAGTKQIGATFDVNDSKIENGWTWYRLTDDWEGGYWCCAKAPYHDYNYLTIIEDKTNAPSVQAEPIRYPVENAATGVYDLNPDRWTQFADLFDASGKLPPYDERIESVALKNYRNGVTNGEELTRFKDTVPDSYETDYSFVKKNVNILHYNLNLNHHDNAYELNQDYFKYYDRFKVCKPEMELAKTYSHVFFTRPDLNLLDKGTGQLQGSGSDNPLLSSDPNFLYLWNTNPNVIKSLTKDYSNDNDFNLFLSSRVASFEITDEVLETESVGENLSGFKVTYGKSNYQSLTAGTFNVSFNEDNEFTVYKTMKAWTEYISAVFLGKLKPKDSYMIEKIIDYAASAYYFVCGPDGETILYAHKFVGIFPTNVPASTTSWSRGNVCVSKDPTIQFAYSFRESINMMMLAEFNEQTKNIRRYSKIYDPGLAGTGNTFVGAPFVDVISVGGGRKIFKLRFKPIDN